MENIRRTIETVWRIESAKIIAALTRRVRDLGLAEDLAHDALVAALEAWPRSGVPQNPGAWLMTAAKNRAIDRSRRSQRLERKLELYSRTQEAVVVDFDAPLELGVEDDLLRLVFMTCHPILSSEARVALTLRLLGGLTTEEIARAYLVQESTIAQRLVRAKRSLSEARVAFEVPQTADLLPRLASVLEVIYLIFNEGYSATSGEHWMRPTLCNEALRLGRIVAELLPLEPEVHGLVALMEIQASRIPARVTAQGEPILLLEQNRARWDQLLIRRGLTALDRAGRLNRSPGPYELQAAIAACHARAKTADQTDWNRITGLYADLNRVQPSPIIELNRAVAVSMAQGPAAGLVIVDVLRNEPALQQYAWLSSVRGDLLFKLNRRDEAAAEFQRAASLTSNSREQELLLRRATACRDETAAG